MSSAVNLSRPAVAGVYLFNNGPPWLPLASTQPHTITMGALTFTALAGTCLYASCCGHLGGLGVATIAQRPNTLSLEPPQHHGVGWGLL